jgi:hypothetical protein
MNTYKTEFFCLCPLNETRIKYFLEIATDEFKNYASGFHELIAEDLHKKFGGKQTLVADHHGVTIETTRP